MAQTTYKDLLEAGAHFGHLTRKWDPKMAPYIFMEKNGIHIIDLNKTLVSLDYAATAIRNIAKSGRKVMFVATKKQAQEIVTTEAERLKMPFVTERWLGGIADLGRLPAALFVVDVKREHIAVKEAHKLGIPVFAMCDTNSNPELVQFPIPANDDASKSIQLIVSVIGKAIEDGLSERKVDKEDADRKEADEAAIAEKTAADEE